jgi:two-component system chemotaxis response regulator CheB
MSVEFKDKTVLIIDSRVLVRRMLSQILRDEANVSNLITMDNTRNDQTLVEIENLQPDLIFVGMETVHSKELWLIKSILNMYPKIPVVLLTSLTPQGAWAALSGLKLGAVEYITIPDSTQGVVLARKHFRKRLIPLIKALPKINMGAHQRKQVTITQTSTVTTQRKFKQKEAVELVVVSGCMGGVRSLYDLISSISEISVPVIIVQHMPKIYTRQLAADLDVITPLNVREAEENSILLPGQVYVAPGGYHTVLKNNGRRNIIKMHRGAREMKYRPSIDVLLRSAVNMYQDRVLGVFLSGGGKDGILGAEEVLAAGGEILVQSRKSSSLWDLPGAVQSIDDSIHQYDSRQLGEAINSRLKIRKSSSDRSNMYTYKKNGTGHSVFKE